MVSMSPIDVIVQVITTEEFVFMSRNKFIFNIGNDVECRWIEICTKHRKFLLGTFYRPPNSPPFSMLSIETSIGLAFDTTINDVIVLGDFNLDMQKLTSSRNIQTLYQMYTLSNIISEPTHFTELLSSLIDLFLVTHKNHILLSGVGEPFLGQIIRFHCPIYEREIWLYDNGNYNSLTNEFYNI